MPVALPLTTKIAQDYSVQRKFSVKQITFGEGYVQSAPFGTALSRDTVDIQWVAVSAADRDTITTALDSTGGWDYLTWTLPGESTSKRFLLKDGAYKKSNPSGNLWSISCTLIEVK